MYEMEVAEKEKDDSGKIDTVHVYYESRWIIQFSVKKKTAFT